MAPRRDRGRSALSSPRRAPLRSRVDAFFEEMAERIGRVFPERSTLRVSRMTVEGERRRLMDAGLEAHPLETFPRSLLLDAHQDRAPQFLPARFGMHEHAFHFAVSGRIDAQRAAAKGFALAPRDEEADVGRAQRIDVEDVVAF